MMSLTCPNLERSVRNSVSLTTSASEPPEARATASRLRKACRAWAPKSSPASDCVAGSSPIWPDRNTTSPVLTACEYGPIAAGAFGVVIICLFIPRLLGRWVGRRPGTRPGLHAFAVHFSEPGPGPAADPDSVDTQERLHRAS